MLSDGGDEGGIKMRKYDYIITYTSIYMYIYI